MVRLKDAYVTLITYCTLSFNSNMVRLKVLKVVKDVDDKEVFQFQYGAIKRPDKVNLIIVNQCFNSNMVRLKEVRIYCIFVYQISFNSNMVRLKDN